jgi:hypothetical protein
MNSYKYNYYNIINIKPNNHLLLIAITSILLLIIGCLLYVEIYDTKTFYAIANDGILNLDIEIDNSDTVINAQFIKIGDKYYKYRIVNIGDVEVDANNFINYQTYSLIVNRSFQNNEVNKVTFYYNKQRIGLKIWKMLF